MTVLTIEQQQQQQQQEEEVIRACSVLINAWESNTYYTEQEICLHLEEITKVLDGKNDFDDFLIATALKIKEQHWVN